MIAPRRGSSACSRGEALIEVTMIGLLLMAPLIWALGVLASLHRGALAATAAARAGGIAAARSTNAPEAERALVAAVARALADHGLRPGDARTRWALPAGLARGGAVEVQVSYPVPVLAAPLIGRVAPTSVWVRATHAARIDPYRSRP